MTEENRERLLAAKAEQAEQEALKTRKDTELVVAEIEKTLAEAEVARMKAENERILLEETQLGLDRAREKRREELATDKHNHVYIFDSIVGSTSVDNCIKQLTQWTRLDPGCDIEIIFNSPGGSIIDGFALFDFIQLLRSRGHFVTTTALGMAASMAGVLLQAGDKRVMGKQAVLLIHEAAFMALGKTGEVEDTMEFVKKLQKRILDIFAERSKLSAKQLARKWHRKDWWLVSEEAMDYGLVDEVR